LGNAITLPYKEKETPKVEKGDARRLEPSVVVEIVTSIAL